VSDEIQQNRYDQLIRRVGGIIGPGSKVAEVITELFPMIDVENVPGELLWLMGTGIAFGGNFIAAVPAELPRGQLFNPEGSGKLVTITTAYASPSASSTVFWGVRNSPIGTGTGNESFRDRRAGDNLRPGAEMRSDSSALAQAIEGRARVLGGSNLKLEDPNGVAVLPPGWGFELSLGNVNLNLDYSYFWRERVAEQSELNF